MHRAMIHDFLHPALHFQLLASKDNTRQVKLMQDDEASEGYIFDQTLLEAED